VIVLQDASLLVRLDPAHGAEILDLVDLRSGRQLLGRPPFASDPPRAGELDEDVWTRSYRGGWQLACPNAGTPCVAAGEEHGFHGGASNDPWEPLTHSGCSAVLSWRGHGLRIERRLELVDGALEIAVRVSAERRAPLVAVEHCALGLELLDPEVELELPAGDAYELSEEHGPPAPPAGATRWPDVRLLDGYVERGDRWSLAEPRSRLLVLNGVPEGRAVVRNRARRQGFELTWDANFLRHLWIWHEVRTYGARWRRLAEILVVEPASVPHSLGLATAIEHDQAAGLDPGESLSWRVTARPLYTRH
jgi:hypothetical protein